MKHIKKGPEPAALTDWKKREHDPENQGWKPSWAVFRGTEKQTTHQSLLDEQGKICCYCMCAIDRNSSHIEHIKPRSKSTEKEKLEYNNMLASCQGEDESAGTRQNHCGHYRKNWYKPTLFVSPLDPECEASFRFLADGSLLPSNGNKAAKESIKRLNLDYSLLVKNRKAAIMGILGGGAELPTVSELKQLISIYKKRNQDGDFLPYCIAVLQVLEMYV